MTAISLPRRAIGLITAALLLCGSSTSAESSRRNLTDEVWAQTKQRSPYATIADDSRPVLRGSFRHLIRSINKRSAEITGKRDGNDPKPWTRSFRRLLPNRFRGVERVLIRSQAKRGDHWQETGSLITPVTGGPKPSVDFKMAFPFEPGDKIQLTAYPLGVDPVRGTVELKVDSGAFLDFAIGVLPAWQHIGPVNFLIEVCRAGVCDRVFSEIVEPPSHREGVNEWLDRRVSLSGYAGQQVALRFSARAADDGALAPVAFFADPVVRRAGQDREPGPNLLLISIDTLGADHLGSYGYTRPTSPYLDRFFKDKGSVFEHCIASASSTMPSHMTMMTSLTPSVHMAHNLSSAPLPSGAVLLPEWLRSHGFVTAAVTENGAISRSRGFGRGFSIHKESRETESSSHRRTIETTFGQGLALIRKLKDQRFFMFLHTYKPHNPYLPPVRYAKMFGNVDPGFKRSKVHTNWTPLNYDREIRYVDDQVRKLFQTLEREGVLENTIVVFTSDHGEAFLEHGYFAHGAIVYDEVLRVPLMLSGPGIPKGLRVREPVSLLDLMPSLLELLEVESPEGLMGRSYRGLLMAPGEGDQKADRESWYTRPIFSEALEARGFRSWGVKPVLQPTYAVREGSLKLIRFRTQGGYRYEFYDLSLDPGEKINLYDRNNPQAMRLQKHFTRYEAVSKTLRKNLAEPDTQDSQISPMDAEMLRALGYLE